MLLVLPLFLSATMTFVNGILAKNGIWRKNSFLSHFFFFFLAHTCLWHFVCKALEIPRWDPQVKQRFEPKKGY